MSRVQPITKKVQVEFFYDTSSPWTYLAFARIREVCKKNHASLVLIPMLVGGVFNAANKGLYAAREQMMAKMDMSVSKKKEQKPSAKEIWSQKDMTFWADYLGLHIRTMLERFNARTKSGAPGHPISSVKMLRGALIAAEESQDAMVRFSFVSFDAYWGSLADVNDDDVILDMHKAANLKISPELFLDRCKNDQDIKNKLRENTETLIKRGGFGSPSIFISSVNSKGISNFETQMHWGNDRMELVEAAILKAQVS